MKVTALLPDDLVKELRELTGSKTLTESLTIAVKGWISITKIKKLNEELEKKPLTFQKGYTAERVRELNRSSE